VFFAPPLIAEETNLRAMVHVLHIGEKEAGILVPA
jgi:hypothetical protein